MRSLSFTLFGLLAICNSLAPPPAVTTICRQTQLSAAIYDADHDEDGADCYILDDGGRPIGLARDLALQTPHAGRKFRPSQSQRSGRSSWRRRWFSRSNRRFTEGWYYRLTLPEYGESFVFIFSIEDAGRYVKGKPSPLSLACMQLLGPGDTYLVQVGAGLLDLPNNSFPSPSMNRATMMIRSFGVGTTRLLSDAPLSGAMRMPVMPNRRQT